MVEELAARHALAKEVIDGVTERTGGVPLFVEEVTRLILERGEQGGVQAIPPTLQQSLTARLDRLGPAREVAQIGSVIGRDFSYALLRAVAGMDDAPLQMALDRLADADIVLVQGLPPDFDYRFKHALIQDAAYENLLKSRRQVLHRRVGETSARQLPVPLRPSRSCWRITSRKLVSPKRPSNGGARQDSGRWSAQRWSRLARNSRVRFDQIATFPATPALRREQIKLQVALITPLIHVKGYAAPETRAAAERAHLLIRQAETLGEAPKTHCCCSRYSTASGSRTT